MRNTARFLLANLAGFDPKAHLLQPEDMLALDRWAISKAAQVQAQVIKAYDAYEFHQIYQRVHNFCNVDMGSFYLDVIKDRQYTTQENSVARRSAQTAMYHIVNALVKWIAPILSFTAEEIWRHIPGDKAEQSVLLTSWSELPEVQDSDAMNDAFWSQVLEVRDAVSKQLEQLRIAGGVGSSLAAEVDLYCGTEIYHKLGLLEDELRFALITSYARIHRDTERSDDSIHYTLSNGDEIWVTVAPSAFSKCERCWHHREDVGSHAEHPTLCGRCVDNVDGDGEPRKFV
jgi:isoleucyl-tRNA synthetase